MIVFEVIDYYCDDTTVASAATKSAARTWISHQNSSDPNRFTIRETVVIENEDEHDCDTVMPWPLEEDGDRGLLGACYDNDDR